MLVELGNNHPVDTLTITDPDTGDQTSLERDGKHPCVSTIVIPDARVGRLIGLNQRPDESYEDFVIRDEEDARASERALSGRDAWQYAQPPETEIDDERFASHPSTHHIAETLASITEPAQKTVVRRALLSQQMSADTGQIGLPDHEAFVAVASPNGFWRKVSKMGTAPAWVRCSDYPGLETMLADFFGCPIGAPPDLEDLYLTRYGTNSYPPGAAPDPLSGFEALHTTYGRLNQALVMGGYGYVGTVGTATAATATTLTGSAETGVSHGANDCAGMILQVGPNAAGTGSKVYGIIISNTSGTTPVYTVDRWYNPATPGGAAGTTPNATGFYSVIAGPAATMVALSTDATAVSLAGTAGTQDAPLITTALTGEITTAGGGLNRKIAPIGQSGATWTSTPVFTANGTDSLPATVAKAASSPSMVAAMLNYMTLVTPTAVMSASGDQLTLTWTFTMT